MKYSANHFAKADWAFLQKALEQKARHLKAQGISHLPPIFDLGDRVGFFFGHGSEDHSRGVIIADEGGHITIMAVDGRKYEVSPFLIFALAETY